MKLIKAWNDQPIKYKLFYSQCQANRIGAKKQILVEILVVAALVGSSQYPRDRILWILTEHGGKMERSRLRSKAAMRYAQLNPILVELVKEGRIRISEEIITIANTT